MITADKEVRSYLEQNKSSVDPVAVKYNKKYGRHVVATRDILPGEIVLNDAPYITCINLNNAHAYCGHCLKFSWACIPCNNCSWIMFCSEECKQKAWAEYHDIECNVLPRLLENKNTDHLMQASIRALVKGIREAGNFKAFRGKIELINAFLGKKNVYIFLILWVC